MATKSTTKTYKVGMMRKDEETGHYIFEEYSKEESKFYDITTMLDEIIDQDGTSFTFKLGEDLEPDAEEM